MNLFGRFFRKKKLKFLSEEKSLIGIIGGSGIYELPWLTNLKKVNIETPYGKPSELVSIGEVREKTVAFIPRHGFKHTIPPHKVPYKANLAALKLLGANHIIGTCVAGSIREKIKPGMFVIPNQFINFTWGRDDDFEIDKQLIHLPMAYPYCEHTRKIIVNKLKDLEISTLDSGTVVVVQGPRFSTISESKMFALWGGDIINMTQYPECYFARELGICYAVIASVTDYDASIPSAISMNPESMEIVLDVFHRNTKTAIYFLEKLVDSYPDIISCNCASSRIAEYYKLAKI